MRRVLSHNNARVCCVVCEEYYQRTRAWFEMFHEIETIHIDTRFIINWWLPVLEDAQVRAYVLLNCGSHIIFSTCCCISHRLAVVVVAYPKRPLLFSCLFLCKLENVIRMNVIWHDLILKIYYISHSVPHDIFLIQYPPGENMSTGLYIFSTKVKIFQPVWELLNRARNISIQ